MKPPRDYATLRRDVVANREEAERECVEAVEVRCDGCPKVKT